MSSPLSSEDEQPLSRRKAAPVNGSSAANGAKHHTLPVKISNDMDRQVEKDLDRMDIDEDAAKATAGISLVNGPMGMDIDKKPNGAGIKRHRKPAAYKEESDDSDAPLTKRRKAGIFKKDESSDDDVPLAKKARKPPKKSPTLMGKGDSSNSDVPLVAAKLAKEKREVKRDAEVTAKKLQAKDSKAKKVVAAKKANGVKKEESSDDEIPLAKKKAAIKKAPAVKKAGLVKKEPLKKGPAAKVKGKGKAAKEETPATGEEGEEEEEYKWWENQAETDGTQKWTTLEHRGVLFAPPYEPLPKGIQMKYDGVSLTLALEAEEVAGFYGAMLETPHAKNPKFNENFFKDFQDVVKDSGGARGPDGKKISIKSFDKCDFTPMFNHFEEKKVEKKAMTAAEKKAVKAEKDEAEKEYQTCLLDGRKEKVGNFRVEPPGLFRGRGDHPKTGKYKHRVQPEQITINIGKEAKVPVPPAGHKWAEVKHDNTVTWLATWKENINGNIKYVMLAATSSLKGQSDYKKFEKARELKKHIGRIRTDYKKDLKAPITADRQRATAMYLIDEFALRAGNEKGEDEADTVGCCSLRFEHVTLELPNYVIFDFLGKDSIRFYQKVAVDLQVFKNLKIFKKNKENGDLIFDRLETTQLNKHLSSYMQGLSAKVFRTYNASWTMQEQLAKIPNTGTVHDKFAAYQQANRQVAILCNHQRTVSTTHEASMEKALDKIKATQYQKLRIKRQILYLQPKRMKKDPDFFKPDPEIDEDWIQQHQKELLELEREKITKKFNKENEKKLADGEKEMKPKELNERLKVVDEMEDEFKDENKTGKVQPKNKSASVDKLEESITKIDERIRKMNVEAKVKDENKTVALGTSKINYIDPRLTVMFCKKYDVPIEKLFPKTLREKFKWALESADEKWTF